jgi:hypothetical protein
VPVRIAIDRVPPGIPLVSGMTATVTIKDAALTPEQINPSLAPGMDAKPRM